MAEETMVNETNTEAEDELLDEVVEEEEEDDSVDLASALEGEPDQPADQGDKTAQSQGTRQEPGYVKSRIDKAVAKAIAETEARMQANFDKQMAPYREQMIAMEAQDLVRSGKVKDLETAKELVRYRQGQPPREEQAKPAAQPRNSQGRFSSRENTRDPETSARIDILSHQADRIREQRGIDVIAEFSKNEDVKKKVVSGEWDFYDVADMLSQPKKKTPAPMRSPNGASGYEPNAIESMSDAEFEKLEKRISGGTRVTLKR